MVLVEYHPATHYKANYLVSTGPQFLYLLNASSGCTFVQETLAIVIATKNNLVQPSPSTESMCGDLP